MTHRFLHVSDPHVGKPDGYESLNAAAHLAAEEGRILLVTGDVTENGSEAEMKRARLAIRPADHVGAWVVPGNHDVYGLKGLLRPSDEKRARFCRIFSSQLGKPIQSGRRFPYTARIASGLILVGIDTNHHTGALAGGAIDPEQHTALRRFFRRRWSNDSRFLVLLHHHPVEYGLTGPHPFLDLFRGLLGPQLAMSEDSRRQLFENIGTHRVLMLHGHKHLPFNTYKTKTAGKSVRVVGGASINPGAAPVGGRLARVDISPKRFVVRQGEVPGEYLQAPSHHGGAFPARALPARSPESGEGWRALLDAHLPRDWRRTRNSKGQPVWSEPSGLHLVRLRVYKQHLVARMRSKRAASERSRLADTLRATGRTDRCNAKDWYRFEWRVGDRGELSRLLDELEREWGFGGNRKR